MPYLTPERRGELRGATPETAGDLTFLLTMVCDEFIASRPERFEAYAQVLGALEATKLELYRRRVAPYEDFKLEMNGDVYTRLPGG